MVNLTEVRTLARLCERGVVGAESQLLALRRRQPERLGQLLEVPPAQLATAAPELLVQVRTVAKRARGRREQRSRRTAEHHLAALGQSASVGDRFTSLDSQALVSTIRSIPRGSLHFELGEHSGSIDLRLLRRLVRVCKGVTFTDTQLEPGQLVVRYRAKGTRGRYALRLSPEPATSPVFRVSLARRPPPAAASRRARLWDHVLEAVGRAA